MAHWEPPLMGAEEPEELEESVLSSMWGEGAAAAAAVEEAAVEEAAAGGGGAAASLDAGAGEVGGGAAAAAAVEDAGGAAEGTAGGVEAEDAGGAAEGAAGGVEAEAAGRLIGTTVKLRQYCGRVNAAGGINQREGAFRRRLRGAKGLLTGCLSVVGRVDGGAATGRVVGRGNRGRSRSILLQQVISLMSMTALSMLPSRGDAEQHRRSECV